MSDLNTRIHIEDRLPINAFARQLGVSIPTVWRWVTSGVRGHVLPTFHIGGRRFVGTRDYEEWFARINGSTIAGPTLRERELDADRAEAELAASGA